MKCLIVFSVLTLGCALAQNDGRYYPELLRGKFDDGQYRPDNAGSYRPDWCRWLRSKRIRWLWEVNGGSSGFGSGNRFASSNANRARPSAPAKFTPVFSQQSAPVKFTPVFAQPSAPVFVPASSTFGASNKNRGFGGSSASRDGADGVKEDTREMNEDGYSYRFLTENQIQVAETGRIENRGSDNEVLRTNGFYEFVGDDGVRYRVDYVADENGFQAQGDHLPTPPPIPEEIVRALQQLSQN
nr:endocuticle structural glycoprotein SgAbd-1-like [Aedes albopictus]